MIARHVALYRRVLAERRRARPGLCSSSIVETPHRSHGALRKAAVAKRAVALKSANASP
jgi:hypothetical protein